MSENTLCLGIHNIAITKLTAVFEDLPLKLPQEKLQGKLKKKQTKKLQVRSSVKTFLNFFVSLIFKNKRITVVHFDFKCQTLKSFFLIAVREIKSMYKEAIYCIVMFIKNSKSKKVYNRRIICQKVEGKAYYEHNA